MDFLLFAIGVILIICIVDPEFCGTRIARIVKAYRDFLAGATK